MKSHRRVKICLSILCSTFALFLFCIFVLYPPFSYYEYEFHDLVSVQRMIKKWGDTPFDAAQFKKGSPKQRAAMASDIVQNQKYLGQSIDLLLRDLGEGDRYPSLKEDPEYTLERAGSSWRNNANYFLEFYYDDKDHLVKSISVVQRCCKSPYATFWYLRGWLKLK
jgi:hypothetical protein